MPTLRARGLTVDLGGPWLMGVVNASPDSFSGSGAPPSAYAHADVVDVGGESAITGEPAVAEQEEIARVVPAIERVAAAFDGPISVDTYKPAVAEAAIAAGASIVNDVSGLRDPALAEVCAQTGAALVVMHTRAAPKERRAVAYDDVVADVLAFLTERMEVARGLGVADEQLVVDPGPDFAKTPAQTIALLRRAGELHALGRPILLAIGRKDFIGALTRRAPRERDAGTLAALAYGADAGAHVFRVHDVAGAADFLTVRAALRGEREIPEDLELPDELRREP